MPACLPKPQWAPCAALIATLLLSLSACGPERNKFPPPCPGTTILGDAADINLYRPGGGRDLTDLVLHGRIVGMQGTCQQGDKRDQLAVSVSVGVELTRGPAMQGLQATVPVFIAVVTAGDTILDKRVYSMRVDFPSNVDRVTMAPGTIQLVLPVGAEKSGADYTVVAGFQLTPDQLTQSLQNRRP